MTSAIDPTKPAEGNAYTADVRDNFAKASSEISALQAQVATALSDITTLQSQNTALQADIVTLKARQMSAVSGVSANPPNTNSPAYVLVMDAINFMTNSSTRGIVIVDGQLGNTSNASESQLQMYFGTGTPPTAGTLLSTTNGTAFGAGTGMLAARSGDYDPFSITGLLEQLTPQTPYWVGIGLRALSGTATLSQASLVAFEVLDPLP